MAIDEKSFYYLATWDDAAVYQRALEAMNVPFSVESPGGTITIPEGQLALVFPDLPVRKYSEVRELFGGDGERYPHR